MIRAIRSLPCSIFMIVVRCPSLMVASKSLLTPLFPTAADESDWSDADAFDSSEPSSLASASSSPRGRQKRASSCE